MSRLAEHQVWLIGVTATVGLFAEAGCTLVPLESCVTNEAHATFSVTGVYRYRAAELFDLSGTITFAQEGDTVRVIDTTYDFVANRALTGIGDLEGNRLIITLVPRNGDTNYRADVTFLFSDDGDEFCVAFSDTNADTGELGSFIGIRLP